MRKHVRRQHFVDHKVQGGLMLRVVAYWGFCLVTVTLMLLCWRILTGPVNSFAGHLQELFAQFGPALVASVLLLPIVVTDVVRFSNRFTGPIYRMRRAMRQLADGDPVSALFFRDGDFWKDFADDFNRLAARVQPGFTGRPDPTPQETPEPVETA